MLGITYSAALIWAAVGIVLLIAELATLSFILCFLGFGAIITAVTTWIGLTAGINSQLLVFSISSILLALIFRQTAKKLFFGTHDLKPDYIGQKVKVVKCIPPGKEGAIEYRGSEWIAFSDEAALINEGDMVEIISIDGIRVKVKPV